MKEAIPMVTDGGQTVLRRFYASKNREPLLALGVLERIREI